jgi:hypothetical protein
VVERLGARLCLAGHGRTFTDVHAHIAGNRALVGERLAQVEAKIATGPLTAFEIVPRIFSEELATHGGPWLLSETLAMLIHLQATGRAERIRPEDGGEAGSPERWRAGTHASA